MVSKDGLTLLIGNKRAAAAKGTARAIRNEALDARDSLVRVAGTLLREGDREWAAMALIAIEKLRPLYLQKRIEHNRIARTFTATYASKR